MQIMKILNSILQRKVIILGVISRAVDPHSFFADPDPAVFLNADPDPAA